MKLRKSLLCVLALVMMLGLLCVTAFATEMQTPSRKNREVIPFQVNPAYEDIYQAEDLAPLLAAAEEEGKVSQQMPALQTGDTAYLPMKQAALQLRQQMKNRRAMWRCISPAPTRTITP